MSLFVLSESIWGGVRGGVEFIPGSDMIMEIAKTLLEIEKRQRN